MSTYEAKSGAPSKCSASRRRFLKAAGGAVVAAPYIGVSGVLAADPIKLRVGTAGTGDSPFGQAGAKFVESINAQNVGLQATWFPNRALGDERVMAESVRLGTVDAATCATGNASSFTKK